MRFTPRFYRVLFRLAWVTLALTPAGLAAQAPPPLFDSLLRVQTDTVYFATGSWELDSSALALLQQYPAPRDTSHRLYLTGHTDAVGSEQANELLARRRAAAVTGQLTRRQWDPAAIVVRTFGERLPVASNVSEEVRWRNRRVTLDYYEPVPYTLLNGRVIDPANGEGVDAQLRVHSRTFDDSLRTRPDGTFQLRVPVDSVVGIDVYAEGYFWQSQFLRVRADMPELLLELPAATRGAAMDIPNLYFFGNQAVLLPKSIPELPKIKRFLEMNPNVAVEIAGHVNYPNQPPVMKSSWEWDLSVRRARFVYTWLVDNGIAADRLTYRGYGNHQMRFPNATREEEMSQNRRVEVIVQ
jgi:outer membrane protein OmpA-like peptidoglycan-associated protein